MVMRCGPPLRPVRARRSCVNVAGGVRSRVGCSRPILGHRTTAGSTTKGWPISVTSNRAGAHVTVAIRRREDDRILVLADGTLPMFEDLAAGPWQVVSAIGPSMEGRFGVRVSTLRPAWVGEGTDERLYEALWLGGAVPSGSDWVPRADLPERLRGTSDGVARAIADGALEPAAGDRQPWYRPGWLDAMTSWIDDRFAAGGLHRRGPVRQVRSWGRSALLQADTDRGLVWAKQVPTAFAHEVAVTGLLADLDPGLVPPIIAADPAAGRLLLAHVEGPLLSDVTDPLAWTATLARLAETQRVLSVERDRLVRGRRRRRSARDARGRDPDDPGRRRPAESGPTGRGLGRCGRWTAVPGRLARGRLRRAGAERRPRQPRPRRPVARHR